MANKEGPQPHASAPEAPQPNMSGTSTGSIVRDDFQPMTMQDVADRLIVSFKLAHERLRKSFNHSIDEAFEASNDSWASAAQEIGMMYRNKSKATFSKFDDQSALVTRKKTKYLQYSRKYCGCGPTFRCQSIK